LAGTAGTIGAGGTVVGSGIGGTAATAGLLGTGGAVGLGGYLTAGAVGAQLGGQLAGEDYAGAIGTAASAVNTIEQARRDQEIYGYQPTKEGRATTAALAAKAGISIDRAAQIAQQRGVTVDQVLAESQGAADDRAIENERYQSAAQVIGRQQGADALDYLNDDIEQFGGNQYAGEPDDGAYMEAQKQRSSIESDIAAGNITRAEANQLAPSVRQLVGKAALGRKHRKPPTLPRYDASGKQVGEMTPGLYENDDGITTAITTNKDGTFDVKWKTGSPKLPAENVPPLVMAAGPEAVRQYQREASHHALRARGVPEHRLDEFFIGKDGVPEQIKVDGGDDKRAQLIEKFRNDLTVNMPNSPSIPPKDEQVMGALAQYDRLVAADALEPKRKALAAAASTLIGLANREQLTEQAADAWVAQLQETYGDVQETELPGDIREYLHKLGNWKLDQQRRAAWRMVR
jgi:hypothetical protein